MLQYLNETLGIKAKETFWNAADILPLYLKAERKYSVLYIEDTELLLIRMESKAFNLTAFRKQLKKLHEYWCGDVVLCFERLTAYQRKALVENKISFIVPESQLYLPALGIVLQERTASGKKEVSKLSASSQSLLLYFLYHNEKAPLKKVDLSKRLGVSAMNITRAVQELCSLNLVEVQRTGRSDYVLPVRFGKQLYDSAKQYLIDPVQKRIFVTMRNEFIDLPLSGESALAERTMLNIPATPCRAIDRKTYRHYQEMGMDCIDPAWYSGTDYIELEIWKYDPMMYAENGVVDIISLASAFANTKDERIEIAVEEMLEGYKW